MAHDESSGASSVAPSSDKSRERLAESAGHFILEFSKETDRAAVILVGARLDYLLCELLARFMLPNTGSADELLDTDRAVGTFSARIHAAHRLGLIGGDLAKALHIFRRLRNTFAHETAGSSLDQGASRDRIRELTAPLVRFGAFSTLRERFSKDRSGTAADFFTVSAILVARLESASHSVTQVSNSKAVDLVPPVWTRKEDQSS